MPQHLEGSENRPQNDSSSTQPGEAFRQDYLESMRGDGSTTSGSRSTTSEGTDVPQRDPGQGGGDQPGNTRQNLPKGPEDPDAQPAPPEGPDAQPAPPEDPDAQPAPPEGPDAQPAPPEGPDAQPAPRNDTPGDSPPGQTAPEKPGQSPDASPPDDQPGEPISPEQPDGSGTGSGESLEIPPLNYGSGG